MSRLKLFCMSCACILFAACASTTIYPEANNTYSLVTTANNQASAEKDAKKKAEEHCLEKGQRLEVIGHKTTYQGADKNAVLIGNVASVILGGGLSSGRENEDYQVTMRFTCK